MRSATESLERPFPIVRCDRPEGSAVAALTSVCRYHGLELSPSQLERLTGLPAPVGLGDLVVSARLLGFDSVPLEGAYADLQGLERPCILMFRGETQPAPRCVVLCEIDADAAKVADPLVGAIQPLARAAFEERWTGDCLRIVPDAGALARVRERLALARSPMKRLAAALRFAPPRLPKLLFVAGAFGLCGLTGASLHTVSVTAASGEAAALSLFALATAALSALWLSLFSGSCSRCDRARLLTGGLPLGPLGALFYTALLGARLALPSTPLVYLLAAAVGAHIGLLGLLIRARTACTPCVLTALAAFTAAGPSIPSAHPALAITAFLCGLGGVLVAVRFSQRAAARTGLYEARRMALAWSGDTPPGAVRLVVWKRPGCASCLLYEAALRPALIAQYGDTLLIDEQDAGRLPVPVPLILVAGAVRVLFLGLPGSEDDYGLISQAVESARDPALAVLRPLGGVLLVSGSG